MDVSSLRYKVAYKPQMVAEGQGHFTKCGLLLGNTACSVNATPNLGR